MAFPRRVLIAAAVVALALLLWAVLGALLSLFGAVVVAALLLAAARPSRERLGRPHLPGGAGRAGACRTAGMRERDGASRPSLLNRNSERGHMRAPFFELGVRRMKVSDSGNRDPLTGVATEAALMGFAAAALEAASPEGPPVCFLQIDVDGLAGLHQEHGAALSDAVLLGVADCLHESIRGADLAGRSADGFGICMPELTAAQARAAAQRLRLRVLGHPVPTGRGLLNLTVSIGVAVSADAEAGIEWLVGRAREARHAAQCEGGDRVVAAA